jgi:VIT1/CCC1 family predicted Fe2+/Mn2+ transporter
MAMELEKMETEAITKVKQESLSILDRVRALVVKDQASYNLATDLYKAALEVEKAADSAHDPVIAHWFSLHRGACAVKKADKDLATLAKVLAKSKAAYWADEQEKIRLDAESKAREAARRIAEEAARIAREVQETERKRLAAIEEEDRLRLAAEAEAAGASHEQVTEILETPLPMPAPEPIIVPEYIAPTVAPSYQKAAGFATRWNYSGTIINLAELVKSAAVNPFFLQYLEGNESAINSLARSAKDKFSLPGCQLKKVRV